MAALATQSITGAVSYAAADVAGDTYDFAPGVFLHFKNVNGASRTVTVVGQIECNQGFLHNLDFVVPANNELFIAPVDGSFADESGEIHLTYSAVVGLSLAVLTTS